MDNWFDRLIPTERNKKDRILLKRAVGKSICNVDAATLSVFYANVYCPYYLEEKLFYVACLYCEQGKNGTMEVPAAWAYYSKKHDISDGMIARLVDSPWTDSVAMSLIRLVRRMMADGYSIDMEKLANDIKFWNTERTRLEWARKMLRTEEDKNV